MSVLNCKILQECESTLTTHFHGYGYGTKQWLVATGWKGNVLGGTSVNGAFHFALSLCLASTRDQGTSLGRVTMQTRTHANEINDSLAFLDVPEKNFRTVSQKYCSYQAGSLKLAGAPQHKGLKKKSGGSVVTVTLPSPSCPSSCPSFFSFCLFCLFSSSLSFSLPDAQDRKGQQTINCHKCIYRYIHSKCQVQPILPLQRFSRGQQEILNTGGSPSCHSFSPCELLRPHKDKHLPCSEERPKPM